MEDRKIVEAMYSSTDLLMARYGAGASTAIAIITAVPQGCPLNGSMFVLLTQGGITLLGATVDSSDILAFISMAPKLWHIFRIIEQDSSLRLKPTKYRVVPRKVHEGDMTATLQE